MLEVGIDWIASQWLDLASLALTGAALFYAVLAYRSSRDAATAARASELASLRIQAKSALAEANRSLLLLRSSCQTSRADWQHYAHKHLAPLGGGPVAELLNITQVERDGAAYLGEIEAYFAAIDEMNEAQLEKGFQDAKTAAHEIERLAGRLERPLKLFN